VETTVGPLLSAGRVPARSAGPERADDRTYLGQGKNPYEPLGLQGETFEAEHRLPDLALGSRLEGWRQTRVSPARSAAAPG